MASQALNFSKSGQQPPQGAPFLRLPAEIQDEILTVAILNNHLDVDEQRHMIYMAADPA